MALELSHNREQEALRAHIAQKLGGRLSPLVLSGHEAGRSDHTQPKLGDQRASRDLLDQMIGALTGVDRGASNEWVVGGSRTVERQADPRQRPASRPQRADAMVSRADRDADGSVKGATVPGAPIVLLGQNDHIAWGMTTADTDTQDLFVETIDPSDPAKYLTPDGPKPFETREETIRVKGARRREADGAVDPTRTGPLRRRR